MKLFLAAPWSGLPSALTALLPQASRLQRKGGVRSELALPDHSDRPFFAWSFLALEVGFFQGELALRTERYQVGRAWRQDFLRKPSFCFQPDHKNLC
jgi:hypothetical protein